MDLKILMIDDHPPIIEGYKIILSQNEFGYKITTSTANDCETAYNIITNTVASESFDLVFIDITLPSYSEKSIYSGEDLIPIIRKYQPNTKIVVLTSHAESIVLSRVLNNYNPEGILVKSDITSDELLVAFSSFVKDERYYSKTVLQHNLKADRTSKKLDNFNKQIIIFLSQGLKTKSIQEQLHLSKSAIDKRKLAIKEFLDIEKGNDEDILREARKRNLI